MSVPTPKQDELQKGERLRRRQGRNWAVFLALLGFVMLVYIVTITKIKMGYGS
jgi:hypothetical protein